MKRYEKFEKKDEKDELKARIILRGEKWAKEIAVINRAKDLIGSKQIKRAVYEMSIDIIAYFKAKENNNLLSLYEAEKTEIEKSINELKKVKKA